ncbi:MAG: hypothetical protein CM15mV11_2390 [Caudoviricetes sp.]|nr:MAG: hypothetical protein CM15mV11_2390 [Caudoviricetes sp.]
MKEFDYDLDYKRLDFTDEETRKLYRIGRGEQGVLLVRPYTDDICAHWRFKTPEIAIKSSNHIFSMYLDYRDEKDFIGMDMCRKFLEMGHTLEQDVMQIITQARSMMLKVMSNLKRKTMPPVNMLNQQQYLKKLEILSQKILRMLE